jgi:hypothetical protein
MARKRVSKDVPTIIEAGYPQLASEDWARLMAKRGWWSAMARFVARARRA